MSRDGSATEEVRTRVGILEARRVMEGKTNTDMEANGRVGFDGGRQRMVQC